MSRALIGFSFDELLFRYSDTHFDRRTIDRTSFEAIESFDLFPASDDEHRVVEALDSVAAEGHSGQPLALARLEVDAPDLFAHSSHLSGPDTTLTDIVELSGVADPSENYVQWQCLHWPSQRSPFIWAELGFNQKLISVVLHFLVAISDGTPVEFGRKLSRNSLVLNLNATNIEDLSVHIHSAPKSPLSDQMITDFRHISSDLIIDSIIHQSIIECHSCDVVTYSCFGL